MAHTYSWQLDSVLDLEHPDRARFRAVAERLTGVAPEPEPEPERFEWIQVPATS